MAAPQNAPLPPDFVLESGMQVVITAIDATTGNLVSNVTVANASLSVDTASVADLESTGVPPILVPESV